MGASVFVVWVWRFFALGAWLLASSGVVHAEPAPKLVLQSWLEDPKGRWSLAEVENQTFTPFQGILTRGYRPGSVVWLKLTVAAGQPSGAHDVLRLRPTWHDRIELYDPADPRPQPRLSGDQMGWAQAEHPSLTFDFLVARADFQRDIYLRVQTVHTHMLAVELLSMTDAVRHSMLSQLTQLAYVALLAIVLLWSLAKRQLKSDGVLLAFVMLQVSALLHAFFLFGMARPMLGDWFSPGWLDQLTSLSVLLYPLAGIYFHLKLLAEYGFSGLAMRVLSAYLPASVLVLLVFAFGYTTAALQLNAWLILLFAVNMLWLVWTVQHPRPAFEKTLLPFVYLKGFYTVFACTTLAGAVALLGLFDARGFQLYAFFPHGFLSAVVMAMLLQYRVFRRSRMHQRALQIQTRRAREERQRREEQSSFLAMLNHEIKTPLAVIRLALSRSAAKDTGQRAVNDVVALLDKCLLLEDLDGRTVHLRREMLSLDELVRLEVDKLAQSHRFDLQRLQCANVFADKLLCETVVSNLLENALKYAPPGTPIRVGLASDPRPSFPAIRLSVANNIGQMGAPDGAQVFEKYYRAPAARSISGSGLGLYIVKRLALMHGGDVQYEASATCIQFDLFLPC
jgi:signal transduction histidine kinase